MLLWFCREPELAFLNNTFIAYRYNLKSMNITIFTDESGVKLPKIKKWKNSLGKGKDIAKDEELISLLEKHDLPLPEHNIELEKIYHEVLHDYLRPVRTMFSGMFPEVRDFKDYLSNYNTYLYTLSGRYGLLEENEIIIPYVSNISDTNEMESLEKRTSFSERMLEKAKESDIILIFLPINYIRYLLSINWFTSLNPTSLVILVTSKHFKETFSDSPNFKILERKGVARIGSYNRGEIISIINDFSSTL